MEMSEFLRSFRKEDAGERERWAGTKLPELWNSSVAFDAHGSSFRSDVEINNNCLFVKIRIV